MTFILNVTLGFLTKSCFLIIDEDAESEVAASLERLGPEVDLKAIEAALDPNGTAALSDVIPTAQFTMDVTKLSNTTVTESDLSAANDPKSE